MPTRAFNHVAVTVTDIDYAMIWYRDVLQMNVLVEPTEIRCNPEQGNNDNYDPHLATVARTVFGPELGKFKICHLSTANGAGIELFQFLEPAARSRIEEGNNFEYWKTGYSHIGITEENVEELAHKIASSGGKLRTEVMELVVGSSKKICFCEDPFGNIIEIYSHSYEQFWPNAKLQV
jgi:catechol 2,3-dioxygenase-like lactoylglutathione lyase family enzyme